MANESEVLRGRRALLQIGVAAAAAGIGLRVNAQQKLAKNLVQYQDSPKNGQECDKCVQFVAPEGCKVVDGKINPKGWCSAYAPKS